MALGNWEGGQVGQGRDVPSDEMPTDSELPSSQNEQVRERKRKLAGAHRVGLSVNITANPHTGGLLCIQSSLVFCKFCLFVFFPPICNKTTL